jgi:hydroxyacylglutathione hydrolase
LLNHPVDSNCYIIKKQDRDNCLIVDPARGEGVSLYRYLSQKALKPDYIILTHEHFDHISSVEYLRTAFACKVIASVVCSVNIGQPKKNLSVFHDQVGFSCGPADVIIQHDDSVVEWEQEKLHFFLTPGHSDGGLSFYVGHHLFTGDTLMNGFDAVTKLPGGNKQKLQTSIQKIITSSHETMVLCPGHGEICQLRQLKILKEF